MRTFLKYLLLFFTFFSFSEQSNAQTTMNISGKAMDTLNHVPVQNAIAMVIRLRDSVLVSFKRTDANGGFEFKNLPIDTVQLIVTHPKFDNQSFFLFAGPTNHEFAVGNVVMPALGHNLKQVTVYAYKDPMYYKGDTLIYTADSFKTKPNAVVEDLLKKLPGIEVAKDGSITSQGKSVDKVYVDGDEFFGTDPTVATKNLAASGVESVQVYEEKNKDAGETGDETIQVMNLKLKKGAKKGYFGRVSGASDFMKFYEGELLTNYFNGDLKVSVFALGSNTPRSNFGQRDVNKFGLRDDDKGGFNDDDVFNWRQTDNNVGIPQTLTGGFYFSDKFGKKKWSKLNANYTFKDSRLNTHSDQTSQYFLTDTNYSTHLVSDHKSIDQTHALNLHFTQKLDSLTTLEILPSFSLENITQDNLDNTDYNDANSVKTRNSYVKNYNVGKATDFSTEAILTKKFKKLNRELYLDYTFTDSENHSDGTLKSTNSFYLADTSFTFSGIDQTKTNSSKDLNHDATVKYTEPFTKKIRMEFQYDFNYNTGSQSKISRNPINGAYTLIDSTYSNDFNNNRMVNRFGLKFVYESKKQRIIVGAAGRNVLMNNVNQFNNMQIHQNISNVLPQFSYRYKFSEAHRLYFRYYTNSSQPTIAQLQPIPNNINPNIVTEGNPNLRPSYTHNFNLNYNIYKAMSGQYVYFGTTYTITNNGFSSSINFDNFGRQVSKTVNTNGNQTGFLFAGAGFPFLHRKITIKPNASGNYIKTNSIINNKTNTTTNLGLTGNLDLEFDFDSIYFNLTASLTYTSPRSTLSSASSQPYGTQVYGAEFEWYLPLGFAIKTDGTYTINSKRTNGYNIKYFIWNASVSKAFLRKQNLILSFEANDMLNQNINANRVVSSNVITDNKTKIISRYLLLRLTYKFSNSTAKEDNRTQHGWF